MDNIIECPKHNGRFDYKTGEAKGAPVCVNLKTYPVKVEGGKDRSTSDERAGRGSATGATAAGPGAPRWAGRRRPCARAAMRGPARAAR